MHWKRLSVDDISFVSYNRKMSEREPRFNARSENPEPLQMESEQQEKSRMNRLVELFESGMNAKDIIGYHGTSLESIEFLAKSGHLPGGLFSHAGQEGKYLYFFPKKSEFLHHPSASEFREEKSLVSEAADYAESIAGSHCLLKRLGLDIGDRELDPMARNLVSNIPADVWNPTTERDHFLNNLGIKKTDLDEALDDARKRKGVVLALNKTILTSHTLSGGDPTEGDLRILIPEGLSLDYISGLEPIGQVEWEYFEKLQEKPPS